MRTPYYFSGTILLVLAFVFSGCHNNDLGYGPIIENNIYFFGPNTENIEAKLQEALINMNNNGIIDLASGKYEFKTTLSLDGKDGITIRGAGLNKTILSFANQQAGAEGLKITNCTNLLLKGFTVENTKGDGIKTKDCTGVTYYQVGAVWTNGANEKNGAYGLYPVNCQHVLMDGCYAYGVSDAGIYVGQSNTVIVRNCKAEQNVAGIEIENTSNSDVYNNTSINNTGGILVFDLPNLLIARGAKTRVFNNQIIDNNQDNFAPAGNIVGEVPPGTGVLILATDTVEVFNNTIKNNNRVGVGIINYLTIDANVLSKDADYDPYPEHIAVYNNNFSKTNAITPSTKPFALLFTIGFAGKPMPDVLI